MIKRISVFLLSLVLMLGMPSAFGAGQDSQSKKSSSKTHKTKTKTTTTTTSAGIVCKDGTVSHAKTRRGACSHHGGIK